jgi:integrase/recombinase XerD
MDSDGSSNALVTTGSGALAAPADGSRVVPAIVAAAGDKAARRYLEFFAVTIENPNTRQAHFHACRRFFDWCERKGLTELIAIEPAHVAAHIRALGKDFEKPTVKQHLAAIRMLFRWLVVGQVAATNPAHSVRGPKHVVKRGKTPVLTPAEARKLLDSIKDKTRVGLRDRALIVFMTYSFGRVGAAVAMRVEDYYPEGKRWLVRLHEKDGKRHDMPCHHNLEAYLDAYLQAVGILEAKKSPLFRSARGRTGVLTESAMNRVDVYRMILRRARDAGLDADVCCHTFRATGITAYLENGGTLENAQAMAAHEARVRRSSMTARATKSRSTRSSES